MPIKGAMMDEVVYEITLRIKVAWCEDDVNAYDPKPEWEELKNRVANLPKDKVLEVAADSYGSTYDLFDNTDENVTVRRVK
jgi:uncharacterized protein (DUF111 family)